MNLRKLFSNRRIVISGVVLLVVAAGIIGGTIAYFQDVEISAGNRFVAGKLNLKIDNECYYNGQLVNECTWELKDLAGELYFNFLDVKPGDFGEDTVSLHVDNNDAWICAELANLVKDDNGCEKPESDIDTTCGAGQGELQDNLFFSVWKDNGTGGGIACNNIKDGSETYIVEDQSAQAGFWPIADSQHGPAIPGGSTICYGVKWNVPLATSNIIQSDSLVGDVIFTAVQSRHMDNFICSPAGPCVPQAEICDDGLDNDCDGDTDCADSECNGQTCNDGLYCNGVDTCSAGSCSIHTGDPCAAAVGDMDPDCSESCNEANNNCTTNDPDGSQCTDGIYCNGYPDTCSAGICLGTGDPCPGPDGDADCSESCREAYYDCNGNDPAASACNDGLFCTAMDTCNASGSCIGTGNPCPGPDGDPDCAESCNETNDNCTANDPDGSPCNDPGWYCISGSCIYP